MMASPNSVLEGDVHIPLCERERCRERLLTLSKVLEEKDLKCVTEYKITGTFDRWFQEAFENCKFTIIHRCHFLWNKINRFETLFSDSMKAIAVDMSSKAKNRSEQLPSSNSGFINFFASRGNVSLITDEESLKTFVTKVVKLYEETVEITKVQPDIISFQSPKKSFGEIQISDHDDNKVESYEVFEDYSDLFGHNSHVSIRKDCVKCTKEETVEFSELKSHEWADWREKLGKEYFTLHSKFVIHRILPALYKEKKAIELAYIAICSDAVLQGEAMILLEMLLLNKSDGDREFNQKTQIHLESILFEGLIDLCPKFTWSIQRLSALYIMNLSDMIIGSTNERQGMYDIHLTTVIARCSELDDALNELRIFIEDAGKSRCSQMKKTINKFIQANNPELGEKLCKENSAIQTCVIVKLMKQTFESLDTKNLEFLYKYVSTKKNSIPSVCMTLLARCITIFLCFGLKKMTHHDLQSISKEALKIINLYLEEGSLKEDMYIFMQILLFNCNPWIQEDIFKCGTIVGGSERSPYGDNQLPFLLNQLEKLLSPFLLIDGKWKDKRDYKTEGQLVPGKFYSHDLLHAYKTEGQWEVVPGKFDDHDVLICVHSPIVKNHRKKNETGCNSSEDMHCNEMKILEKLQHKNIIKMFAFQDSQIPLFYVVEDHFKYNLQIALKHKRENKDFFSQSSLFKFLVETVTALEYCHSKLYVHCNLTAESLFIINGTYVKLCGFHLCLELVDGRGKIDEKNLKEIPIRWTAPESLSDKECTTASDIWMFGHLIYEVLTHGLLPYAHSEDLENVTKKIRDGKMILLEEPYFKREHYRLITDCTAICPQNRPSITEVRKQLESFSKEFTDAVKPQTVVYPYDQYHKPSTENEKGLLAANLSSDDQTPYGSGFERIIISDTINQYTLEDKYIFREKIVHRVTQDMAIKVEDGKLNDILSGVKICQNHGEVHHIECHISKSCQGSLLELAFTKALGKSLKPYMDCLLQVASTIKKLHERSWVLGDMCASYLYVEQTEQDVKVYVVSLAYLLPYGMKAIPENTHICARAAPEVIRGGVFSPDSDVYCFGYMMWEVLTAFDHLHDNVEQLMMHIETTHATPFQWEQRDSQIPLTTLLHEYLDKVCTKKVSERWEDSHKKPHCCPDNLFELMTSCVNAASTRRIPLDTVVTRLQRICQDLEDVCVPHDSRETSA